MLLLKGVTTIQLLLSTLVDMLCSFLYLYAIDSGWFPQQLCIVVLKQPGNPKPCF